MYVPSRFLAIAAGLTVAILSTGSRTAWGQCQTGEAAVLTASDGYAADRFGYAAAMDGEALVIGAYDYSALNPGKAYVFAYDEPSWYQVGQLFAPDFAAGQRFGYSVAMSGDWIIVGAPWDSVEEQRSGAAYVYVYDGGTWQFDQKLLPSDPAADDFFGAAVAIDGNVAVVGAWYADAGAINAGAAYMFRYSPGGNWVQEAKLQPDDPAVNDNFGAAVAILGNRVLVGAPGDEQDGTDAGAAYIFSKTTTWVQQIKLRPGMGSFSANCGAAVSLGSDLAYVGAPGQAGGYVDIYRFDGATWPKLTRLTASGSANGDHFGQAVHATGDKLIVGATGLDDGGSSAGGAYLFQKDNAGTPGDLSDDTWSEELMFVGSDRQAVDFTGQSVAVSGDQALIGSYGGGNNRPGKVYVLAGLRDCNQNSQYDVCDIETGVSGDCNSNGIPDDCETGLDPTITQQPQDETACEGSIATFHVAAQGRPPFTYQWRKNGQPLSGATGATLTLNPVAASDAGSYDVIVNDACASVTSQTAALTVRLLPAITQQPEDQTACVGEEVRFSVAAVGAPPLSFQWRRDGADLPGQTSDTLVLPAVTMGDGGTYDVVLLNSCGTLVSATAVLTVSDGPAILASPTDQTVCAGSPEGVTFTVDAQPTGRVIAYQWRKDGVALDLANGASFTIAAPELDDAGTYDVVVTDECGFAISAPATLSVIDETPGILQNPDDKTACEGGPATFGVAPSGPGPYTYQWRKDGLEIPGAQNVVYVLSAVTPADAGEYDVVVGNPCGSVTSDPATLTVALLPTIVEPPQATAGCLDGVATFTVSADGAAPLSYQWLRDGAEILGATDATLTLDPVTLGDEAFFAVVVTNDCGEVVSTPVALSVRTVPLIITPPADSAACEDEAATFAVSVDAVGTVQYQWRRDGEAIPGAIEAEFTLDPVTPADTGALFDVSVTDDCGSVTSGPALLTVDLRPTIVTPPEDAEACTDEFVEFTVTADGTPPLEYEWYHNGERIGGADGPALQVGPLTPSLAGTYFAVARNLCGDATTTAATLTVDEPPTVITPPQAQSPCAGETVVFTVEAGGTAPLSYQWRHNGQPIDGATDPNFTILAVQPPDAGAYDVEISNLCGVIICAPVALAVDTGPTIGLTPQDQTICEQDGVTFCVEAVGHGPLHYQWRKDGEPIASAPDAACLSISSTSAGDAGAYDVVVSDDCGSNTSTPAVLTVNLLPRVEEPPQPQATCEGAAATFSVVASGAEPLDYQWRRNGVEIEGAIASTYTIAAVTLDDAASYDVVISNGCATATSAPAELTIRVAPAFAELSGDVTVCAGEPVTLQVSASGSEPLSYQWRRDGVPLDGETGTELVIAVSAAADTGTYDVIVTNDCGPATSAPIAVAVHEPPVIVTHPLSQIGCAGENVTLEVAVSGSAPFTYQWYRDGAPIAGATKATYTLSPGMSAVGLKFRYEVAVTNDCGEATSSEATLTVRNCALPAVPTLAGPADGGNNISIDADLDWTDAPAATAYDVYFGPAADPPLLGSVTWSHWELPPLEFSTAYTWRIVAKNEFGETAGSNWSFTTRSPFVALPGTPAGPLPTDGAANVTVNVELSWDAVDGAELYYVYLGLQPPSVLAGSTVEPAWTPGKLQSGQKYYWQIVARNAGGLTLGPVWSFTTASPAAPDTGDDAGQDIPNDGSSGDDDGGDTGGNDGGDSGQDTPGDETPTPTTGLCPLVAAAMLGLTVSGLWRTRSSPGRKRA